MGKEPARRLRLLPLTMASAASLLILQVVTIVDAVVLTPSVAAAQQPEEAKQPKANGEGEKAAAASRTPDVDPALLNRSELDILNDLSKRRQALEEQARQLALRERLLEATEKRIDGRIAELRQLEAQVEQLVAVVDEQEEERLNALVGYYEKMKSKDAARIFERLDMDIQMAIARRMKQSKMAPILADMQPEAARALTTKLAESPPLPSGL